MAEYAWVGIFFFAVATYALFHGAGKAIVELDRRKLEMQYEAMMLAARKDEPIKKKAPVDLIITTSYRRAA